MFKHLIFLKELKSLDVSQLFQKFKELLWTSNSHTHCHEDRSKWTNLRKILDLKIQFSIWNNRCSIWQDNCLEQQMFHLVDNFLELRIPRCSSISFEFLKEIVKLKLLHPYFFKSLKINQKKNYMGFKPLRDFFSSILFFRHVHSLLTSFLFSCLWNLNKYFNPPFGTPIAIKIIKKRQEMKNNG